MLHRDKQYKRSGDCWGLRDREVGRQYVRVARFLVKIGVVGSASKTNSRVFDSPLKSDHTVAELCWNIVLY